MRILLIDRSHPVLSESLQKAGGFELIEAYDWSKAQIAKEIALFDGLVIRSRIQIDREILDQATNLKFIAREGVGLEHIDLAYAESKNVKVIISPEGSKDTVGEHAIGMLLALSNRILLADQESRKGIWNREGNRATEIKDKIIGIIGYGNMGQSFAKKISGFEPKAVLAYDKYRANYGDQFAQEANLETIWAEADILTIHIPYETSNHYFINANFLSKFKKPIYLINTARGLVLDTAALVEALKADRVIGAGLDVLEYEDLSFNALKANDESIPKPLAYLRQSDRVVLAPHIAGWSFESKRKHGEVLAEKIILLKG